VTTIERKVKLTRSFRLTEVYDAHGGFIGGGVLTRHEHMRDELWVQVTEDPVLDRASGTEGSTGRLQIHLGSSRRALEELGVMLLAIAHYEPPESGYRASVELSDREGNPAVHLIVHLPIDEEIDQRPEYAVIHNAFSGRLYDDGTVEDRTLPVRKDDDLSTGVG
jgi:hypothetical protein